ncbi:hypothetical protein GCM10009424_09410 [Sphingomonas ursincola]|uniref:Uncharacterized protein n=1 Tax=Sphingomonas ursincola TaxID=56361 RepID=A0A7V8REP7_9SPHN|nr:hypothetical protein [Sphingomonas ursincola]MBA1375073.1 hypothetical protein [Sphingomonas ursincola]
MKSVITALLIVVLATSGTPALAGPAKVYRPDPSKKQISNGALVSTLIPARDGAGIARTRSQGGGAQYIPQTILNPNSNDQRIAGVPCQTDLHIGGNENNMPALTRQNGSVYVERLEVIETRPCLGAARGR